MDKSGWLFFEDFVRPHILHDAAKKPICCAEIAAKLTRHGYRLHAKEVISLLDAMEQAGSLAGCFVDVSGKPQKHYEITSKGRKIMEVATKKLLKLADEVME
jgi:DNA-binding PadR family transcriptional regulator